METVDFSMLFSNYQGHNLYVLLELSHPDRMEFYFTNNASDLIWNGKTYKSAPMAYSPPSSRDGVPLGGSLEIDIDRQQLTSGGEYYELLKWFDLADEEAEMKIAALIDKDGGIIEAGNWRHRHGAVNWDGKKIIWNTGEEPKLNMQANSALLEEDCLTGAFDDG